MGKEGLSCRSGFLVFLALLLLVQPARAEIITALNVSNTGPIFTGWIHNFTIPMNYNLLNALNLSIYFSDDNGDPLTFFSSDSENVTAVVNSSTGMVSFYPDTNFIGTSNITFYAADYEFNTSSNLVFLFLGLDSEAPKWYTPAKNRATIYQSDFVNFTTIWTDNYMLANYSFFLYQGNGWEIYSENMTGTYNISRYRAQINASYPNIVYWRFCAYDTSTHFNCTDLQSFNLSDREEPGIPEQPGTPSGGTSEGTTATGSVITGYYSTEKKIKNYTVFPDNFKVSLRQGGTETRILKITNIGHYNLSFNLSAEGVNNFTILSDNRFDLEPGWSKEITIDFKAGRYDSPEQYFGKILVISSESREVPVVIDLNPLEFFMDIDVQIPEKYKRVRAGKDVLGNITIRNLKDSERLNLTLYYAIKDFYGEILDFNQEDILLDSYLNVHRVLTVPPNTPEGDYIFYARVSNQENISIDSDSFEVGVGLRFSAFLKSTFIILLLAFLALLALILIWKYKREKEKEKVLELYLMLSELKRLIEKEDFDHALELYTRIKNFYNEKIPKEVIGNKERLKEELKKLADKLNLDKKVPKIEKGDLKNPPAKQLPNGSEGLRQGDLKNPPAKGIQGILQQDNHLKVMISPETGKEEKPEADERSETDKKTEDKSEKDKAPESENKEKNLDKKQEKEKSEKGNLPDEKK